MHLSHGTWLMITDQARIRFCFGWQWRSAYWAFTTYYAIMTGLCDITFSLIV